MEKIAALSHVYTRYFLNGQYESIDKSIITRYSFIYLRFPPNCQCKTIDEGLINLWTLISKSSVSINWQKPYHTMAIYIYASFSKRSVWTHWRNHYQILLRSYLSALLSRVFYIMEVIWYSGKLIFADISYVDMSIYPDNHSVRRMGWPIYRWSNCPIKHIYGRLSASSKK